MRLSTSSIAISILASALQLSTSSAADPMLVHRMLAKNEQKASGNSNKSGSNSNKGGNNNKAEKSRGGNPNQPQGAHLDTNDAGISTNAISYTYGEAINIDFELTNDLIPADVRAGLDIATMDQWTVGLFMRMANPQGGALAPITSVAPISITAAAGDDGVGRKLQVRGSRTLQETSSTQTPPTEEEEPTEPDEGSGPPPDFNHVGSATFVDTSPSTLPITDYGTGFDIYLLDEHGRAIIGPATVYMTPTQAMIDEEEAKSKKGLNHPLARLDHGSKKKKKGKGGNSGAKGGSGKNNAKKQMGGPPTKKGQGYGSGSNGGMIIGAAPRLASYDLHTNEEWYNLGDTVVVSYDLSPEAIAAGGVDDAATAARRMQKKNGNAAGGNSGGNSGNNKNGGGGNSDTTTTTSATDAAADTTTSATDYEYTTTTTTPEPEVDMGAGEDPAGYVGNDLETQQGEIDPTDITLFSVGVYMRMANPQGGALSPITSIPFCAEDTSCLTPDQLESGEFTFSTEDITDENGGGYDVWILNGLGAGIAGPFTFYVGGGVE